MNFDHNSILNDPYFIQGIGFVAFFFGVTAFLQHDDRRFKIILFIECLILAVHYYLLGATVATSTITITSFRNIFSLFKKAKPLAPVFIITYITFGICRYEFWADALVIAAPIVSTFGLFYFEKIKMRLCFIFASSCWIVHNFAVGSIGPFFMEVFIFSSNMITILSMAGLIKKPKFFA